MTLGRLDPYPPGNQPAGARVHVRGTVDEVQMLVEASSGQTADVFQVIDSHGSSQLAVDAGGNLRIGSPGDVRALVLHDTRGGAAYALRVTDGQLNLSQA